MYSKNLLTWDGMDIPIIPLVCDLIFPRNLAMHSDGEDDESDYMSDDDW